MAIDAICGMKVDENTALSAEYNGKKYYFCSPVCHKQFLKGKGGFKNEQTEKEADSSSIKAADLNNTDRANLSIKGMHCASCALSIEDALKKVHGVKKASVNFATEKAYVEFQPDHTSTNALEKAVEDAGYGVVKENYQSMKLKILGMDNTSRINAVDASLNGIIGITSKKLFPNERAEIEFNSDIVSRETIKKLIKETGFTPIEETTIDREKAARKHDIKVLKIKLIISIIFALPLFYFAMGSHIKGLPIPVMSHGQMALLQFLLTTPIIATGYQFYTAGLKAALRSLSASMDTLVALGTGTAYVYSIVMSILIWTGQSMDMHDLYYEVAGMLIAFILLGRFLEAKAKGSTSESIRKLLALQPDTAIVIRDNKEQEVPVEEVKVGDIVIIKPGSRIPVDGTVIEGGSSVDQSLLTGESIPVEKGLNDTVIGGTINKTGWLKFTATKVGADTALAQIIKLVEEAQGSKAPVQRMADKIAAIFVPAVLFTGVIAFIVWFATGSTLLFALTTFISVIIISCPCALGLATPTAIIVGTGKGAENGLLIRDAQTLEKAGQIDVVVFDKTGTLTSGKPVVTDIITIDSTIDEILRLAAAVEQHSEHPLSEAIVNKAKEKGSLIFNVENFSAISGKGVEAKYNGSAILLGNRLLFNERKIDIIVAEGKIKPLEEQGKTVVILALNNNVIGLIAVADTVKKHAAETISWLKQKGIKVIMITGDNQISAESVARSIGIDTVLSEVLPGDKAAQIEKLQQQGHKVAMVGDGINDAPALVQADVGIAIGSGTDIAIESGGIVLVKDDLRDVARSIALSQYTMRKIKQNLFWAFFYNAIGIPIAAGILYPFTGFLLNPIIAGAAMAFSSLSVVSNSLSMKRYKLNNLLKGEK